MNNDISSRINVDFLQDYHHGLEGLQQQFGVEAGALVQILAMVSCIYTAAHLAQLGNPIDLIYYHCKMKGLHEMIKHDVDLQSTDKFGSENHYRCHHQKTFSFQRRTKGIWSFIILRKVKY